MEDTVFLSKTRYCELWRCPKAAWLHMHKPEAMTASDDVMTLMQTGNEVGELARGLFGPYTDVTVRSDGKLNLSAMIASTQREMERQTPVICEASFSYEGLYCAVDILRQENGGWAIYEVKSSSSPDKSVYLADVSYQKYVLEHCSINVTGAFLVCLNNEYIYDGHQDIKQLFQLEDMTDAATEEAKAVEDRIAASKQMLLSDMEPAIDLSECCKKPSECAFWSYCTRSITSPSVFDLYWMPFKDKLRYYYEGLVSYEALRQANAMLGVKQQRQITYALNDLGDYTVPDKIRAFLDQLSYPLYFLDFETIMPAIPQYVGTKPYSQVPFQYSLHYIECEGGELKHKEFLGVPEEDPRRALAERLCEDIPMGVSVTAYNKKFECSRIEELTESFPDLADHLMNIRSSIVDLLVPFQSGWYYNRAMGGSFSIKSVLPALYPDDPTLDYHNLEEIHHGGEAMTAFPAMLHMSTEDRERTRKNLLKYCGLDTYAMVKVWEKLKEAAGE